MRMDHNSRFLASAVLLTLGCQQSSAPRVDATVTIVPLEQWCGGAVQISSEQYTVGDPSFTVGADTLEAVRQDETTFVVTLPKASCATSTIVEHTGSGAREIGTVAGRGFIEQYDVAPGLIGGLSPWPRGTENSAIGATSNGVGILQPSNRQVSDYPGIHMLGGHYRSVGMSYMAYRALLQDPATGTGQSWIIRSQAVPDTLPVPAFGNPYHVMESGPGVWLVSGPHHVDAFGLFNTQANVEGNRGMRLSPDGRHATVLPNGTSDGVPVFDAQTGALRYQVPGLFQVNDVSFGPTDSIIFFGGAVTGQWPEGSLLAVGAGTGVARFQVSLGSNQALSVLAEPSGRFVLVALAANDTLSSTGSLLTKPFVTVLVLDAVTGDQVGELSMPPSVPQCRLSCQGGLLLYDQAVNELFFVDGGDDAAGNRVYRFAALSSLRQSS